MKLHVRPAPEKRDNEAACATAFAAHYPDLPVSLAKECYRAEYRCPKCPWQFAVGQDPSLS